MFTIYHVWCNASQKSYIGQTKQSLARRKAVHFADSLRDNGRKFCRAIRKYGRDAFEWQVLTEVATKAEADNLEALWIASLNTTNDDYGYNVTTGGNGYTFTEEVKAKIRANTPRGPNHKFFGKQLPCFSASIKSRVEKAKNDPINKEIVRLYEAGFGTIQISEKLGIEKSKAYHRLKILGITLRKSGWSWKKKPDSKLHSQSRADIDNNELVKLYADGYSTRDIAKQFNTSKVLVARRLRKSGVTLRPPRRPKG